MLSEAGTTSACPMNEIPAVGTPEYEKYYYKKIEESVYRNMAYGVERFPNLPMYMTWSSMSDVDRKEALVSVNSLLVYGYAQWDIEDQDRLDDVTQIAIGSAMWSRIDREMPKSTVTKVSKGNTLLKRAIQHSTLAREARAKS